MAAHVKWGGCIHLITTSQDIMKYKNNVSIFADEIKAYQDNIYLHYEQEYKK